MYPETQPSVLKRKAERVYFPANCTVPPSLQNKTTNQSKALQEHAPKPRETSR